MTSNPLTSNRAAKAAATDPMLHHARVWQHVNAMPHHEIEGKSKSIEYILPRLGELAGNPNVKSKDVIKAAAQASAARPRFFHSSPEIPFEKEFKLYSGKLPAAKTEPFTSITITAPASS